MGLVLDHQFFYEVLEERLLTHFYALFYKLLNLLFSIIVLCLHRFEDVVSHWLDSIILFLTLFLDKLLYLFIDTFYL